VLASFGATRPTQSNASGICCAKIFQIIISGDRHRSSHSTQISSPTAPSWSSKLMEASMEAQKI
jgi:hypothetical protein